MRTISDLAKIPPAVPLIDGLLYQNTLVQITGNPGSYKSFLAVSMACAVASRKELTHWAGYPVKAHGPVIYVAAEGASGLRARILGWCEVHDHEEDDVDLLLIDHPVQMGDDGQMKKLINTAVHFGAVMVVFDTRARCTLGMDENKADEQGIAIEAIEQLREATGCTTVVLHHSSRTGSAGRGSSVWDGNVWSDLRVSASGTTTTIHCEKHKDVTSGCDHEFELERHSVSPARMPVDDPFLRNTLVVGVSGAGTGTAGKNGVLARSPQDHMFHLWSKHSGPNAPLTIPQMVDIADGKPGKSQVYEHTNALIKLGKLVPKTERGTTKYYAKEE
ncbi:AAA family ATPase [Rhodococcus hoagii]|nr:AAA family ATPase [Prescottella equi]